MKRKGKTTPTQAPRPVPHSQDRELGKALWKAVKVSEADLNAAMIVWRKAYALVISRGTTASFGDGGGGVSPITVHRLGPDAQLRQRAIDAAHWILSSVLTWTHTLNTANIANTATYREDLAACARFFYSPRPGVQDRRASAAKVFIRERFARNHKPVSATLIAKHLGVNRRTVITYIYPLLHQDTGLTCTGRGPAGGWKPRA